MTSVRGFQAFFLIQCGWNFTSADLFLFSSLTCTFWKLSATRTCFTFCRKYLEKLLRIIFFPTATTKDCLSVNFSTTNYKICIYRKTPVDSFHNHTKTNKQNKTNCWYCTKVTRISCIVFSEEMSCQDMKGTQGKKQLPWKWPLKTSHLSRHRKPHSSANSFFYFHGNAA